MSSVSIRPSPDFASRWVSKLRLRPPSVIRASSSFASASISGIALSMIIAWMPFLPKASARSS